MQASPFRKFLLRQVGPVTQFANTSAEGNAEVLHVPDAGENGQSAT
jgi:hypothetical protein